jgi:hypothetical protein
MEAVTEFMISCYRPGSAWDYLTVDAATTQSWLKGQREAAGARLAQKAVDAGHHHHGEASEPMQPISATVYEQVGVGSAPAAG